MSYLQLDLEYTDRLKVISEKKKEMYEAIENQEKEYAKVLKTEITLAIHSLLKEGRLNKHSRFYFDENTEQYQVLVLGNGQIKSMTKETSIRIDIAKEYGASFVPRHLSDVAQKKHTIYTPHKPKSWVEYGLEYANTFTATKYMAYDTNTLRAFDKSNPLNGIDWSFAPSWEIVFNNVFPDKEERDYFINWVAHNAQTRSKARTAIITVGTQGTGKGAIYEAILVRLFGDSNSVVIGQGDLDDRFNGILNNKLMVLGNELKADFRDGNKSYETLKKYVTDSTITVEDKNVKKITISNYFNMWMHSNHDIPIQISEGDRRYTVTKTNSEKLIDVVAKMNIGEMDVFEAKLNYEAHFICEQLMMIKFDRAKAINPLESTAKDIVKMATTPKAEILCNTMKKSDYGMIDDMASEIMEQHEEDCRLNNNLDAKLSLLLDGVETTLTEAVIGSTVKAQLLQGYIQANLLALMYRYTVNSKASATAIGRDLTKYLPNKKRTNKGIRYMLD